MKKTATLTLIFILLATAVTWSQSFYNFGRQRDIIASVGGGFTAYFGDINEKGDKFDTPANVSLGLQYFVRPRVSIRSELSWYRLAGDDAEADVEGRIRRNLKFESNNWELNFVGMVSLLENGRRFYQRPALNPYLFGGIGLTYFNPKGEVPDNYITGDGVNGTAIPLDNAGDMVALQPHNTEGADYNRVAIVVPFGGGLRIKAGPFFNIALEGGYRLTFNDYLDDVSTNYRDQADFGNDYEAAAMADRRPEIGLTRLEPGHIRGDDSDNDGYMFYQLKLEFYLPTHILSTSKLQKNRARPNRPRGQHP